MRAHQAAFPMATMCEVLQFSRSAYYVWLSRLAAPFGAVMGGAVALFHRGPFFKTW